MITPLTGYVVLKEVQNAIVSSSIIVEGVDLEPTNRATVLAVPKEDKLSYKVGDEVVIKRHMFDEHEVDKEQILIGRQEGVVALC